MPIPTGPVQVGVNGENLYLHVITDSTAEAPMLTGVNLPTKTPLAMPMGSVQEMLLGHRSGGVQLPSALERASTTIGGRVAGTNTAIAAGTMTDANANWVTNVPTGHASQDGKLICVKTSVGTLRFNIVGPGGTANTVLTMLQNWQPGNPDASGDEYFLAPCADSGSATAGSASTLTDGAKAWPVNVWMGFFVCVNNSLNRILSNTATVLTVEGVFATNPAANHAYGIVAPWPMNFNDIQRGSPDNQQFSFFGSLGTNQEDV